MELATAAALASAAAAAAGAGLTAAGAIKQGKTQKMLGEFNARELEKSAKEEFASGARKAQERRMKAEQVMSDQRAIASKSGGGTTGGEGFVDLISDTAQRGQYLSDLEIAGGEARAAGREGQAAIARWQGQVADQSGRVKGIGAGLDGISSALSNDDMLEYFGVGRRKSKLRYAPDGSGKDMD